MHYGLFWHRAKRRRWMSSFQSKQFTGRATPVTTLCGQLAALKIQTFRVKVEREEKVSLSQEQSSKHGALHRERTPVFYQSLFGTEQFHHCREPYLVQCKMLRLPAMSKRTLTQAGSCRVGPKQEKVHSGGPT